MFRVPISTNNLVDAIKVITADLTTHSKTPESEGSKSMSVIFPPGQVWNRPEKGRWLISEHFTAMRAIKEAKCETSLTINKSVHTTASVAYG